MVDEEEMAAASAASAEGEEYINDADPSILRFLIAAREEVRVGARVRSCASVCVCSPLISVCVAQAWSVCGVVGG